MKNFSVIGHQIGDAYRGVVSLFSNVQAESTFASSGTLTTEEFLAAGDQLVFRFPTWEWAPASNKGLEKPYLPTGKQYLITRKVPCLGRVRDLESVFQQSTEEHTEHGWLMAGLVEHERREEKSHVFASSVSASTSATASDPAPSISEFADLDAILLREAENDGKTTSSSGSLRCRTYDLSITWDKYYQTPRLWLFGYDENGHPLKDAEIYQDVLSNYASKTVTVDAHPATGVRTASIHPCQHAKMMLQVINDWKANKHPVRPDLSLFVFLKFISGVVPTINYDFTMDIDM
jgi:ubiquitin-like-conjugating enzyme ATG3